MHLKKKRHISDERDDSNSYGFNMADDTRKVRIEEQLRVKIGEAKNLSSRNNGAASSCSASGTRDVYCTVALDQEEICRTPTIERTLSPFFGEEYYFKIPRRFRYLSVYVWDRDRHLKQDKPIGKIAIRREELQMYNHKDHWFSLRPVDADSEVQGMARVELQFEDTTYDHIDLSSGGSSVGGGGGNDYKENNDLHGRDSQRSSVKSRSSYFNGRGRVAVRVHECVELAKKNGACDPYVVFTAVYSNKRQIIKRTKTRKKTVNPQFDEIMHFDLTIDYDSKHDSSNKAYTIYPLGGADLCEICVTLWHDAAGMSEKVFLGEVRIPLRNKQQQVAVQPNAWYYLQPRASQSRPTRTCATPPGTRLSCDNSIGSLRLNLVYTYDHVFPLATYDGLMNLLLESVDQRPITTSAVSILGEVVSCKTDVAEPLVRLFTYTGQIAAIIKTLADHEISNLTDPTTIFRGNTLVSKMMDEAMRLSGLHYLHNTLRPVMEQIIQEKKPCEIDPTKVKDKSAVDYNLINLQEYVERVFDAITKSAVKCPAVLCQIFHDLRECAAKHFPYNREVRYSVVSGFIFLRFFAAAILGPKLFDLTTEPVDFQTSRTLTLISKTIQSLGNLVSSRSSQKPCKEEYTGQLYKKFCTEKHVEAVKHFLEVISTVGSTPVGGGETILEPVLLKEGMMTKHPQGRKRFGRRLLKNRYFKLTTHSLSYAKSKGKPPICDIPLSEILGVEPLTERSFKMQNSFQIIRKDRSLYVQTTNCVEEKEWIDLLSKICHTNSKRLQNFHPCAYVNGIWSCCSRRDENAEGCTKVSSEPFQMELATALDPARDLQRLQTLITTHVTHLKARMEPPIHSHHSTNSSPLTEEEFKSTRNTIHQLLEIACSLDVVHRNYRQGIARELKLGSRMAPIGDDNYLHMLRGASLQQMPTDSSYHRSLVLLCNR